MKVTTIVTFTMLFLFTGYADTLWAGSEGHGAHHGAPAAAQTHRGQGTVQGVNLETATLKIDHEPIESLRWPRMVMDLKATDAGLLKGLKPGDRVAFDLVQTDKGFFITGIDRLP